MPQVEIRVQGKLDQGWVKWLDEFKLTHTESGDTLLIKSIKDQADLYGLIAKLRALGVRLIAIHYGEDQQ